MVRRGATDPVMCIVNTTDRFRHVSKGDEIGMACEISDTVPADVTDPCVEETLADEAVRVNQIGP